MHIHFCEEDAITDLSDMYILSTIYSGQRYKCFVMSKLVNVNLELISDNRRYTGCTG